MEKPELTTQDVKDLLVGYRGQDITLDKIRSELHIERGDKAFDTVRNIVFQLAEQRVLRYMTRGLYKVIMPVSPVSVYGSERERRPLADLVFPRAFDTGMEMDFAEHVNIRENDMITIGGQKSKGKTLLALNLCGENLDKNPVLMGNEYTIETEKGVEPSPRFLNRLDTMSEWIQWTNGDGQDRFTLLPVSDDYAEHVIKDRFNIIDWINIDGGKLYDIGMILGGIKKATGRGNSAVMLQKSEGATNPRGGQFVRDFSDLEILLDNFGDNPDDALLTVKGAKETTGRVVGKRYAFHMGGYGTKILNFREVKQCSYCYGKGWVKGMPCEYCFKTGWLDR